MFGFGPQQAILRDYPWMLRNYAWWCSGAIWAGNRTPICWCMQGKLLTYESTTPHLVNFHFKSIYFLILISYLINNILLFLGIKHEAVINMHSRSGTISHFVFTFTLNIIKKIAIFTSHIYFGNCCNVSMGTTFVFF